MSEISSKCAIAKRSSAEQLAQDYTLLSEHFRSSTIDVFPIPLIILNSYRQIVFSNKAFMCALGVADLEGVLGKRPGEALGCLYAAGEVGGCGTSEYCRECGALRAVIEGIDTQSPTTRECQLLVRDGKDLAARDYRVFVAPWDVNEKTYYVVSIVNIEDEKRRMVLEKIFFHDILNAAGGAQGLIELLMEELPERSKEIAGLVQSSIFKLVDEIKKHKQLLDIERKEYSLVMITLQGLELIHAVVQEYQAHPVALGKTIIVDESSENVEVLSDYTLLTRVLINMTLNALEATAEGGEVAIGLAEEDGHAMFWVKNDAVLPETVQVQIFKRSFSTKGKDRGLGTYSMKLLAENYLGATVGFTSREQFGTKFWIKLPKKSANMSSSTNCQ